MSEAKYFDDPDHQTWQFHYYSGCYGGQILAFTKAWADKHLPPTSTSNGLKAELLDTTDGKIYTMPIYTAFENKDMRRHVMDDDWKDVVAESLQDYFYGQHHCPCHRKQDAAKAGAVVELDPKDGLYPCEGRRFVIKSITAPGVPHVILYSETMDEDALEEALHKAEGREYDPIARYSYYGNPRRVQKTL